jgi:hypothetical protein
MTHSSLGALPYANVQALLLCLFKRTYNVPVLAAQTDWGRGRRNELESACSRSEWRSGSAETSCHGEHVSPRCESSLSGSGAGLASSRGAAAQTWLCPAAWHFCTSAAGLQQSSSFGPCQGGGGNVVRPALLSGPAHNTSHTRLSKQA